MMRWYCAATSGSSSPRIGTSPSSPGRAEHRGAAAQLRGLAGFGAVLVQHGRPHLRLQPQQVGARRRGTVRALAAGFGGEHRVGGEDQVTADPVAEPGERSRDGEEPVEPDLPVDQRRAHRGKHRRQRLTQDRLRDRHRLRGALQPGGGCRAPAG